MKDEVVNYEAVTTQRDLAKDKSDDLLAAVSNVPSSKSDAPTASTASSENKTPNKKISEAVSSSILGTCDEEVIFGNDLAKNVVSSSVKDVASKIVFDELGIKGN